MMAKIGNASISRGIHASDETWMSCMVQSLNNIMNSVLSSHCLGPNLEFVAQDFWSMRRIIEDVKKSGWNHLLPNGCKLLQECEKRFGTHCQVLERFLKTAR